MKLVYQSIVMTNKPKIQKNQMNKEIAQFDKPIKILTEEAALLDYNGDRKNALKRLFVCFSGCKPSTRHQLPDILERRGI